jgi:hypothetical protein
MVSFTLFTFASVSQITDRMLSSVDQPKSVRGGRDMTLSTDCCQYFDTQRHLFQCSCRASAFGSITELNDEEDNDDDDKSDTEDDTVVDSVDTLPNDIFTEYWDVLEEEQDETGFK